MNYATSCQQHDMDAAAGLLKGLSEAMRRALMTHLAGDGVLPVLHYALHDDDQHQNSAAVWDALVKARPGYLPPAREVKRP